MFKTTSPPNWLHGERGSICKVAATKTTSSYWGKNGEASLTGEAEEAWKLQGRALDKQHRGRVFAVQPCISNEVPKERGSPGQTERTSRVGRRFLPIAVALFNQFWRCRGAKPLARAVQGKTVLGGETLCREGRPQKGFSVVRGGSLNFEQAVLGVIKTAS